MLSRVHVKNLILIEETDFELQEGFNILTGETGAGKSILMGAIELCLGGKVAKDIVREGCDYGLVELVFEIQQEETKEKLQEYGVELDDGILVVSRKIKGGKCVNRVNGETVTVAMLKQIRECLIDIYGQHEHQTLMSEKNHLKLLDHYANSSLETAKGMVSECYKACVEAQKRYDSFDMDEEKRLRELDLIQFELDELEEAALKIGEDEEVEQAYKKCSNAKVIEDALEESYVLLSEEGASKSLTKAIRLVASAKGYDEALEPIYDSLMDLDSILSEVTRSIYNYKDELVSDEEELVRLEERLDLINRLKGKYGNSIEKILAFYEQQKEALEQLEAYEANKETAKKALDAAKKKLLTASETLSELRKKAAKPFEASMVEVLQSLNFLDVRFELEFGKLESPSANGIDRVRFMISTNPGEALRPLVSIASGGELSRIMLGLKTIFAHLGGTETLIFDEIDTGISGRTAQMVAEKIAMISRNHQVICISHLPQLAAMADAHFFIEKKTENGQTRTMIRPLDESEMTLEIARMLGGVMITDSVRKNAAEMKALANEKKSSY